jgi:hypothetical protein
LNDLLGVMLRTPVVELKDNTLWDVELNCSAAFYGVVARRDWALLANPVGPWLPVYQNPAATTAIVINNR